MIAATTSARMPPLALAAAAGLHLLVAATALTAFERGTVVEEVRAIEIELAAEAEPTPPQPEAMPATQAQPPAPAEAQAAPEPPLIDPSIVAEPEPPPPVAFETPRAAPEPPSIDPSIIPLPEPPPPVAFAMPKAVTPKPAPPKPAPAKPAAPRPADAAPSPLPAASAAPPAAARPPTHDPRYIDRLAAAIERERDYPSASRRRGEQGRVVLTLVIAADGRLLSSDIVTASGFPALDQAALGMVRRARLPPLGPGFGAESATFTIPIVFAIR